MKRLAFVAAAVLAMTACSKSDEAKTDTATPAMAPAPAPAPAATVDSSAMMKAHMDSVARADSMKKDSADKAGKGGKKKP
jgi:hypothetical protein